MEKKKAAASKAAKDKAEKATRAAAPEAAAPEPLYHCEVVATQEDGAPLKIGSMICGVGAVTRQPKAKAEAMAREGWVKIIGMV